MECSFSLLDLCFYLTYRKLGSVVFPIRPSSAKAANGKSLKKLTLLIFICGIKEKMSFRNNKKVIQIFITFSFKIARECH